VCGLKSLNVYGSDLKNGFYRGDESFATVTALVVTVAMAEILRRGLNVFDLRKGSMNLISFCSFFLSNYGKG